MKEKTRYQIRNNSIKLLHFLYLNMDEYLGCHNIDLTNYGDRNTYEDNNMCLIYLYESQYVTNPSLCINAFDDKQIINCHITASGIDCVEDYNRKINNHHQRYS